MRDDLMLCGYLPCTVLYVLYCTVPVLPVPVPGLQIRVESCFARKVRTGSILPVVK